MESEVNHDFFSIVAQAIVKWYDQTHTTMTIARKPPSPLNSELMGILLAAKTQTLGALITLANKHILSTHALLRILVETHVFLKWALNSPANDDETKFDEVYKRFKRWDYTRLKKDKKLFENLPQTPEIKSNLEKVNSEIDKLKKDGVKDLPSIKEFYEEFGSEWKEVYARHYMKYCQAVHLNRNVTQKLAWIQYENGEAKAVQYKDNIEPDGDELLIIASISSDINKAVRGFYNWYSEAMQNEYEQIKTKLNKK